MSLESPSIWQLSGMLEELLESQKGQTFPSWEDLYARLDALINPMVRTYGLTHKEGGFLANLTTVNDYEVLTLEIHIHTSGNEIVLDAIGLDESDTSRLHWSLDSYLMDVDRDVLEGEIYTLEAQIEDLKSQRDCTEEGAEREGLQKQITELKKQVADRYDWIP